MLHLKLRSIYVKYAYWALATQISSIPVSWTENNVSTWNGSTQQWDNRKARRERSVKLRDEHCSDKVYPAANPYQTLTVDCLTHAILDSTLYCNFWVLLLNLTHYLYCIRFSSMLKYSTEKERNATK